MDGFRALAYIQNGGCTLVSRNGNAFASFDDLCTTIPQELLTTDAVLDGEIVCLDSKGKSQFNELLFHRGIARFYAFDLLWLNQQDIRDVPLLERKQKLCKSISPESTSLLYLDQLHEKGEALFELVCLHDLEGIVAKHWNRPYSPEAQPAWVKIKNPNYSQSIGRNELFERGFEQQATTEAFPDWESCVAACSEVAARSSAELLEI